MSTKKKLFLSAAGAASGATTDVDDVFSVDLWKGNASLQIIDNGIKFSNTHDGGSARFDSTTSRLDIASSTDFNLGTGDFTIDFSAWWADGSQYQTVFSRGYSAGMLYQLNTDGTSTLYVGGGGFVTDSTARAAGNWYQYCITRESGTVKLYVNGTLATTTTGNDNITSSDALNIGDDDSGTGYGINGGKQGFISNFRIIKGSAVTPPSGGYTSDLTAVSGTVLLTCQGDTPFVDNSSSSHSITKVNSVAASEFGPFTGNEGEGGMLWTKQRTSGTNEHHWILDTARTAQYSLSTNLDAAQINQTSYAATFNSAGFQIYNWASQNDNNEDYVGWSFRKAPKFFDIVTWTGNGTENRQIAHNLGSAPGMILVKGYSLTEDWNIYHRSTGTGKYIQLNGTANAANVDTGAGGANLWFGTTPTSTHFTVDEHARVNGNGNQYVAYIFAHNNGDGEFGPNGVQDIIKCGSYTGNNSTNGPEINLGFEPQWVFIRHTDANGNSSFILDEMRGMVAGGADNTLSPNANNDEQNSADILELTPTGFKLKRADGSVNGSGNNYIYVAVRRGPLAEPTTSSDVFAIDTAVGTSPTPPTFISNFPVDWSLYKNKSSTGDWGVQARITGSEDLATNSTREEVANAGTYWNKDYMNGIGDNTSANSNDLMWMWGRAPGFCDVVQYTGTGSARTINHNLGVAPEMMWVKTRTGSTGRWAVYHKDLGNDGYLFLNDTDAAGTFNAWNNTTPTSSVFSLSTWATVNDASRTYIAFLFATIAGVSKVGSYTGNGSAMTIDCGFTNGARFVLIKRTDTTDNWYVWDSLRGIVSGNDTYLRLNTTQSEATGADYIDPHSSGFALPNDYFTVNGRTFIFYAIA